MKKVLFSIIIFLFTVPAISQDWVEVNGTVTDLVDSLPVVNHPVTILADSTNGFIYYNVVFTDSAGYYYDNFPGIPGVPGTVIIQTPDCNNVQLEVIFAYDSVNTTFTHDFRICTLNTECEAFYTYYEYGELVIQFQDMSLGNPQSWLWDFGDSTISIEQNPLHYYNAGGWYNVTLIIGNEPAGCFDSFSSMVYVSDSTVEICQALYSFYPEPQGSPDSFQFNDLSTGAIVSWFWDFGDGTFSQEQNPLHAFPGPGTFETCLTVTGNNCSDIYCNTFVISDTVYQQIYGQAFAGNFPLQSGIVTLFALSPSGGYYPLQEGSPVDSNGIYFFSLVPEGTYLIHAVPAGDNAYLPTYYGGVINWQQASQIVLGESNNPYDINLVPAGQMSTGPGSISGQINTGLADRSTVDEINMILMDEFSVAIGFSMVNSQGLFEFQTMDYGTYFLRAELSGVYSDNMKVEITPENPHLDVVLSFSGNSILDVLESDMFDNKVSIYPNPVSDRLTISFYIGENTELDISLYSIVGQLVYRKQELIRAGTNTVEIPFEQNPEGIYTVRILTAGGAKFVKKIVKMK